MSGDTFWLSEAQFAKIEPFLPTDTRGVERVDDRRFTGNEAKLITNYTALGRSGIGMTPVEDLNCLLYRDLLPFTARYHQLALH